MDKNRRLVIGAVSVLLVGAAAGLALGPASAQQAADPGRVVIVSWGGSYQEAQRKAFFEPFQKETGIQVVEGTGPQIERSRAEVQSGRPSYDLTATNQAFYQIGVEQNLWEPIDYEVFRPADLQALPEEVRLKFGVGHIYYTEGMAINTDAFPAGKPAPASWADFWDVQKFPGRRTLPQCDVATYPLPEAALLADGVPVDKLYPIDVPRAVKKLKEIAPHVLWWKDINQPGQLLATQEAIMGMAPGGRVQQLADKGAPVRVLWSEARYTFDVWYILRGSANKANAMKFVAYASRPEPQAEMARLAGYAPTNPRAFDLLDPATARKLPTYPENFRQTFKKDEQWWKANRQSWIEACTAGVLGR